MTLRELHDDRQDLPRQDQVDESGDDTSQLRDQGEAFLAAADDAITRALSSNSIEFLAQNRQLGGQ
jgi:hypothetical protein